MLDERLPPLLLHSLLGGLALYWVLAVAIRWAAAIVWVLAAAVFLWFLTGFAFEVVYD